MDSAAHDVLDESTVFQVAKGDGGWICIGTIWSKALVEGEETFTSSSRLHIATSEAEVVKRLKHYMRGNLEAENGMVDSEV